MGDVLPLLDPIFFLVAVGDCVKPEYVAGERLARILSVKPFPAELASSMIRAASQEMDAIVSIVGDVSDRVSIAPWQGVANARGRECCLGVASNVTTLRTNKAIRHGHGQSSGSQQNCTFRASQSDSVSAWSNNPSPDCDHLRRLRRLLDSHLEGLEYGHEGERRRDIATSQRAGQISGACFRAIEDIGNYSCENQDHRTQERQEHLMDKV